MAVRWCADLLIFGVPPCPLWELPAQVATEVRYVQNILNSKPAKK